MANRAISPLTTWHSQGGLLLISFTWGISYLIPPSHRVPFAEVFPTTLSNVPMQLMGAIMVVCAVVAYVAEKLISRRRTSHYVAWRVGYLSHMVLAATYLTLALGALGEGLIQWEDQTHWWGGTLITAISRPVLWAYVGYLHTTFARLPRLKVGP